MQYAGYDYNRDSRVNTTDEIIARNNAGVSLVLLSAPAVVGGDAATQSAPFTPVEAQGPGGIAPADEPTPEPRHVSISSQPLGFLLRLRAPVSVEAQTAAEPAADVLRDAAAGTSATDEPTRPAPTNVARRPILWARPQPRFGSLLMLGRPDILQGLRGPAPQAPITIGRQTLLSELTIPTRFRRGVVDILDWVGARL